jgi:hypothetical protein
MLGHKKCPVCQLLVGEKVTGKVFCRDCAGNPRIRDHWDSLAIIDTVGQANSVFRYFYPVLLVTGEVFIYFHGGFDFGTVATSLTAWGIWGFNIFWLWPKQNLTIEGVKLKRQKAIDELLIVKVAGKQ